jgi:hypothetical protein
VLEHDETSGFGPETIHISGAGDCRGRPQKCDMKYYLHDFSQTGKMLQSKAVEVSLYTGTRVAGAWNIKDCPRSVSRDKMWWHVLTIDGKSNELKWSCDRGPEASQLKPHCLEIHTGTKKTQ